MAVRHEHKLIQLPLQHLAVTLALLPLEITLQEHVVQLQKLSLQRHEPVRNHGSPHPPSATSPTIALSSYAFAPIRSQVPRPPPGIARPRRGSRAYPERRPGGSGEGGSLDGRTLGDKRGATTRSSLSRRGQRGGTRVAGDPRSRATAPALEVHRGVAQRSSDPPDKLATFASGLGVIVAMALARVLLGRRPRPYASGAVRPRWWQRLPMVSTALRAVPLISRGSRATVSTRAAMYGVVAWPVRICDRRQMS